MNSKDAIEVIKSYMNESNFKNNFGGGIVEEAFHRAITALEKDNSPHKGRVA